MTEATKHQPLCLPEAEIRALCRRHRVAELALFGSALRRELGPMSNVDFLVRFEPGAQRPWMGHFQDLEDDLSALLGRPVDLVDWDAIERSRNWICRRAILSSARTVPLAETYLDARAARKPGLRPASSQPGEEAA